MPCNWRKARTVSFQKQEQERKNMMSNKETVKTRIGELTFESGFPSKDTVKKLYDELDFQRAVQCYIWGLPIVAFAEWQRTHTEVFGATNIDIVIYQSHFDKIGILTANTTTPYVLAFHNLAETGPIVFELPPGPTAGIYDDFWQRPFIEMGLAGPDRGSGGKYLFLGPDQSVDDTEGYYVAQSPTLNVGGGYRILERDPEKAKAIVQNTRIYPYSQRENPPMLRFLRPDGKRWSQAQPRGMAYWELLAQILNKEVVEERDRFMMAMLKPLGIEKGKPFEPDNRQTKILEEAAFIGEAMAKANSFDKRFKDARYRPETQWDYVIMLDPLQNTEFYAQLDERAAYCYEAVTTSKAMVSKTPGIGQAYLGAYSDGEGDRLDGGQTYRLTVPPKAPMKQFWSITIYDNDTRCVIDNEQQQADLSSVMDIVTNADDSVDLYFGPTAPKGYEQNWIQTLPGRGWFAYFRLYAPLEPYFERTWPLPDIEKVK
ncbi:DUF1254 domain-containing protein [Chloroflexota bacterium]